ncbi:MAG: hypothetical protein IPP32_16805 [Bacteroidetes bacterium]|nr:hypothetical protein [Bacteroidota bacterium]
MNQNLKAAAILLLGVLTFTSTSCKKEKLKQPLVLTNPESLYIYGRAGDVVSVTVDVSSDIRLSRFYVTSKIDNAFQITSLDSTIDGKSFSMNFEYKIPAAASGKSIIFTYNAMDVDGNSGSDVKRLVVAADTAIVLAETSGHQLFSGKSLNHQDAFDLETNSVKWSLLPGVDSTSLDIKDFPTDSTDALAKSWISPAHGKFVRANGFDYANATNVSLINAYSSSTKLDIIDNIQLNDIIIIKLGSVASDKYAIIKINGITDAAGKESDSYLFSIKK